MKEITWKEVRDLSPEEQKNFTGIIRYSNGTLNYLQNSKLHRSLYKI